MPAPFGTPNFPNRALYQKSASAWAYQQERLHDMQANAR